MGAKSKHNDWDLKCYQMGYDFTPLAIETGSRQAGATAAFLCRISDIAGCGDACDRVRFRNYDYISFPSRGAAQITNTGNSLNRTHHAQCQRERGATPREKDRERLLRAGACGLLVDLSHDRGALGLGVESRGHPSPSALESGQYFLVWVAGL